MLEGRTYDFHFILQIADAITHDPVSGQPLAEHAAHDTFEHPVHHSMGLGYTIALFRQIDLPHTWAADNLAAYLCDLEKHHDLEDDVTGTDEDALLHKIAEGTETNYKDVYAVRTFYRHFACETRVGRHTSK